MSMRLFALLFVEQTEKNRQQLIDHYTHTLKVSLSSSQLFPRHVEQLSQLSLSFWDCFVRKNASVQSIPYQLNLSSW